MEVSAKTLASGLVRHFMYVHVAGGARQPTCRFLEMDMSEFGQGTGNGGQNDSMESDANVKIIKRYTNRKLYDTVESRYVTLDEIAEMVKAGVDVKIIDNRTKEDLTSITLAQIIFEEEKREGQMPLGLLKRIIQGGGSAVQDFISERVTSRVGALKEEAETRVNRFFRREDGSTGPVPARETPLRSPPNVREMFTTSQRALEDWQRRVDDRVRGVVEAVTGLTGLQRELVVLTERLDAIEKKLASLERVEAAGTSASPGTVIPTLGNDVSTESKTH
jgi:polyhydroxyalkanoate synthesis repressor PhaR